MYMHGNTELLKLPKTAFMCSRKIPASVVLKCYDWAIAQRDKGNCVISGFQSKIEKDVFHFLLQGKQPIILVLARGMKKRFEPELSKALSENRILIISPFPPEIIRPTTETAEKRNHMMLELSDEAVFGFISKGGSLEKVFTECATVRKIPFCKKLYI
jgi:predicted Rossmann fold nucleotide-binding protein DprA/Smf involved in DNA uptake